MDTIINKFTKAVSYTFLASVIARLFGVVIGVLVARSLGSANLGLFAIVQTTIGLFSTIFGLGLGLTATKMIAQYYINSPRSIGKILGLLFVILLVSLIIGGICYLFSLKTIANIYSITLLQGLLGFGIFWFVFITFNQFLESILVGFQAFKSQMFVTAISSFINLLFVLYIVLFNNGNILINLIIASSIIAFIQCLLSIYFVLNEFKKHNTELTLSGTNEIFSTLLLDFSLPAYISKVVEQPLYWVSMFLLVKLSTDVSNVGGLNVISNIKGWILYFPSILSMVLIPILTDIYHTREKDTFYKVLGLNQKFLWLATLPVLVFFIFVTRLLIEILYGASYVGYWQAGVFLLAWAILIPINEVNDRAMISVGKMWLSLGFRMIYMVLLLIMLVLLIPRFQLLGYVLATGVSFFIYVLIQTLWLNKFIQKNSNEIIWLTAFSLLVLSASCYVSQYLVGYISFFGGIVSSFLTLLFEWKYLLDTTQKNFILKAFSKTTGRFS